MKVTVNIDCTPEEARTFMGLPDVKPMQDALMADLQNQMRSGMAALTPENMMKAWLPSSKGQDQVQKMFWNNMQTMFSSLVGTSNLLLTVNDKKPDAA